MSIHMDPDKMSEAELRREVNSSRYRITQLEEGECRFHCRMRKDMWKAGGTYVWEHWQKLGQPLNSHLEQMYEQWKKNNNGVNK